MCNSVNANTTAIATLELSLTTLNEGLNTKTASLESRLNGLGTSVSNLSDRVDDCFQSVSDGKALLADALTDKGVSASASEDFANLAGKIRMITSTSLAGNIKYTYHSHVAGLMVLVVALWIKYALMQLGMVNVAKQRIQ